MKTTENRDISQQYGLETTGSLFFSMYQNIGTDIWHNLISLDANWFSEHLHGRTENVSTPDKR